MVVVVEVVMVMEVVVVGLFLSREARKFFVYLMALKQNKTRQVMMEIQNL